MNLFSREAGQLIRKHYREELGVKRLGGANKMNCPFCKTALTEAASRHVLACALAEISKRGPQIALAKRCERAYSTQAVRREQRSATPVRLLECGCCGQFHPEDSFLPGGSANYKNDCRYDANRFNSDEDFTQRTGFPCVEVWLDEQMEEANG